MNSILFVCLVCIADLLSIDDTKEVQHVLWKYRAKWKLVGMELQLKADDLDAIEVDMRTVGDSLFEVIKLWLHRTNPKPTRTVLTALARSQLLVTEAETQSEVVSLQEGSTK